MAELAAAVRLVYRCDAALLIVRQWLDKLADLERQVTGVVDEFMSEQILTNGHTDAGLAGSTRNQQGARARNRRGGALTALALVALPGVAGADPEVLQSNDQLGLRFEKSSTPQPEGATTTVTVRTGDGKVVQTISEPFKGWLGGAAVELLDIDQDGRDDLLVQVDARVKDGKWAIWHAVGSNPKLSRVGVVDGHPESAGPGLIKADTEQGTVFYVIKGNALAPAPAPAA